MDSFATFLPIDRRHALAAGQPMPDRVSGAALFADISGFTPLTAVLAEKLGPHRGAEELTRLLNHVFTNLIAEVHRFGGSVINFSGDAITCWFDTSFNSSHTSTELALACGLHMQQVMDSMASLITPFGSPIPLALKVAIASGPARRFLVGDPTIQTIEILAGATLDDMADAETSANQSEIVMTTKAYEALADKPLIQESRTSINGNPILVIDRNILPVPAPIQTSTPVMPAKTAKSWLLPPVYARLESGHDDFLAELRTAVAIFIKFTGINYDDDEEAGEKLDLFVRRAQAILNHYDGYLLQVTMGDKGSYFYISMGAPIAHEDDTIRAANAALEIQALATTLDFVQPLQIGINQGLAFSGAYGSPTRRSYGVIGSYVNISARLMSNAKPGQILISESIAIPLKDRFDLSQLSPTQLKGVTGPYAIWQLTKKKDSIPSLFNQIESPMVGREAELANICALITAVENGRSANLLIEGAAGIGKSRLIYELMQQVDPARTVLFIGSGNAIEQNTLYRAWQPVYEQIFNITFTNSETSLESHILEQLSPQQRQYAPLLNPVLPLDLPDTELTKQMAGEVRQENSVQLLVDLLKTAVSDLPLILIIEDAHWLDSASWTLIQHLQGQIRPMLLVIATRPFTDHSPTAYIDLREHPQTTTLQLETLPLADIDALICQRLGIDSLPEPVQQLIHQKAEGHPFFSEELAYALRDAKLIEIKDGTCSLTASIDDFTALEFPDTIQGVITSRIDQLSPNQQLTLKVASVIGRVFAYRLLNDIYPTKQQHVDILKELDLLEKLEITPLESPEPNLAYIFKHIVTQEVAYSLMTYAQRQRLHQKTAVWYEEVQKEDLTRHFPLLAHHWHQAGDTDKAVAYYDKAGQNAFFNYANQEAIRFLAQALNLADHNTSSFLKATWERQIAEAAYRLTYIEQSETHYKSALNLMGKPIPKTKLSRVGHLARQLLQQSIHRLFPNHYIGRASSDLAKSTLLETARAYEGVSEIYYNKGDFLTTFLCVMTAFNLAEEAGPSAELVRGYANMCATLGTVSLHRQANNYRRRALTLADQINDLSAKAWSRIPLSSYSLQSGAWERGENEIGEALAIYKKLGDWRRWCIAAWTLPQISQSKGDLTLARSQWTELYDVAVRSKDTRHQVRAKGGQFYNFLSLGLLDEALACVDVVGFILEDNPEMMPIEERLWFGMVAKKVLQQEKWEAAREFALAQIEAIQRAPLKFDLLEIFSTSAEVLLALWEQGEASANEAQKGIKTLQSYARSNAFAKPRTTRLLGHYAWLKGKKGKAKRAWHKSLRQADLLNMPYEKALTLYCMARLLNNSEYETQAKAVLEKTKQS